MLDCVVQEWYGALEKSAVLAKYKNFEPFFSYECYLDVVPYDIRFHLTRLRLSVHSLRIQTGKFFVKTGSQKMRGFAHFVN